MPRGGVLILAVGIVLLGATGRAAAATITVNTSADDQTQGDGQCSLRKAIAAVDSPSSNQTDCVRPTSGGNTIVLGAGAYQLAAGEGDLTIASTVTGLTIVGAGESSTVIDTSAASNRALDVSGGATVTLSNLTITGAHAPDGSSGSTPGGSGASGANGGAILNQGTLTLTDVAVTNSKAGGGGAGGSGASTRSGGRGGPGGSGGSGGAIYNAGTLSLDGVTLSGDAAGAGGSGGAGGHGSSGGDGGAGGAGGSGGGIANPGGTATVQASTINGDSSGSGGAGGDGGTGTTSAGGQGGAGGAGGTGGGITTDGGTVSITNVTLASNTAGSGGAGGAGGAGKGGGGGGDGGAGASGGGLAAHNPASASLLAVTVAGNQPGGGGVAGNGGAGPPSGRGGTGGTGGAGAVSDQGSSTTLQSTLLALNTGGNCAGTITDGGHDLSSGDASCPSTFSGGDPSLGPLQDNGGPAQTMSLGQGSAAIDQVPPGGSACPDTDERGVPRPSGPACDIGAYEVASPVVKTEMAIGANSTGGTLPALVIPNSGTASVYFQYGRSARYGSQTAVQQVGGVSPAQVLVKVIGLKAKTVFHFRAIAISTDGTAVGADETFTTSATPVISALRISPRAFRPAVQRAARARAMITYTDSRAATTSLVVLLCVRSNGRKCTSYSRVEAFRHVDVEGVNHIPFSARLYGQRLPAGTYQLRATPMAGRKKGSTVTALFRILS